MFELFKAKLMPGMEIVRVKETSGQYLVTTRYKGDTNVTYLHKTCAPGRQNHLIHQALCNIIAAAAIEAGDYETAKLWLDRNTDFSKWAWEYET